MLKLLVVSCLLGLAVSMPQAKNELTCEICVDVITDLDNWLTSDATEQDIVDFVKEVIKIPIWPGKHLKKIQKGTKFLPQT